MRNTLLFCALLAAVLVAGPSHSANAQSTFYVDIVTGNDAFDGSQSAVGLFPNGPIATLQLAVNKAESGDTIYIGAGDYSVHGVVKILDKDLRFLVMRRGADQTVVLDGLKLDNAERTLTLANSGQATKGKFMTNGDENDLTLIAGTLHIEGSLVIGEGGKVTEGEGSVTGKSLDIR